MPSLLTDGFNSPFNANSFGLVPRADTETADTNEIMNNSQPQMPIVKKTLPQVQMIDRNPTFPTHHHYPLLERPQDYRANRSHVSSCDSFLLHIMSCPDCQRKLKTLMSLNAVASPSVVPEKPKENVVVRFMNWFDENSTLVAIALIAILIFINNIYTRRPQFV